MRWKNLVALDYPDIEAGAFSIDCQYGNFGETRKEIFEATTQKDYNFQVRKFSYTWLKRINLSFKKSAHYRLKV